MKLRALLEQTPFLKVIAGIENFDRDSIRNVAQAADGVAPAIDLSVDREMIEWVKANTQLTVFVSSLSPAELAEAATWGADLIELGNYSSLYDRGAVVSVPQVLAWTREVQQLTQGSVPLCVTVPGVLGIEEQIDLARQLQAAGADILQLENITGDISHVAKIRSAVQIPVMISGLLNIDTMADAVATGAEAIGIGAAIRAAETVEGMRAIIASLQKAAVAARAAI